MKIFVPVDLVERTSTRFEARLPGEILLPHREGRATKGLPHSSGSLNFKGPFALQQRDTSLPGHLAVSDVRNDAQTGVLLGIPKSAICVQRFDDSQNSAIHITYRSLLRSSSMHEPRDPPLKVVRF